jgi:hypothetical protein
MKSGFADLQWGHQSTPIMYSVEGLSWKVSNGWKPPPKSGRVPPGPSHGIWVPPGPSQGRRVPPGPSHGPRRESATRKTHNTTTPAMKNHTGLTSAMFRSIPGGGFNTSGYSSFMEYSLLWNGALRTVTVPAELEGDQARWTWAAMRLTGREEAAAWREALRVTCPGLGWSSAGCSPKPYDACVFGAAPSLATEEVGGKSLSGERPRTHNPIHRAPRPDRAPHAKHGGSGTAGQHRPPTQRPTSSASSRPGHGAGAAHPRTGPPQSRQHAMPGKGGWMGRAATKPPGPPVAPRA